MVRFYRAEFLTQGPVRVIRYRSLGAENRLMSATPRKRRLAVKASPVAMGHQRTPTVHNGQEELLNQPGDLCGGFALQSIKDYAVLPTLQKGASPALAQRR